MKRSREKSQLNTCTNYYVYYSYFYYYYHYHYCSCLFMRRRRDRSRKLESLEILLPVSVLMRASQKKKCEH